MPETHGKDWRGNEYSSNIARVSHGIYLNTSQAVLWIILSLTSYGKTYHMSCSLFEQMVPVHVLFPVAQTLKLPTFLEIMFLSFKLSTWCLVKIRIKRTCLLLWKRVPWASVVFAVRSWNKGEISTSISKWSSVVNEPLLRVFFFHLLNRHVILLIVD